MDSSSVRPFLGAIVGLVVAGGSYAQVDTPSPLLTPATVESFIASYPEVKAKAYELSEQYEGPGAPSGAAAWRAWSGVEGAKSQLDAAVQNHGFENFPEWVRVLSVTAQAYAFAQSGEDLDERMSAAIARIEIDPNIPEAQKEIMRQQLQHSAAAIAAMKPSQGNIDAVRPYAEQLGKLFDEED